MAAALIVCILLCREGAAMTERRFPPPWTAEVTPNCFIVRDANGQALSYIYYESEPFTLLRSSRIGSRINRPN